MAQFGPMTQHDTVIFERLLVQGKKTRENSEFSVKFIYVKWTHFNDFFFVGQLSFQVLL